MCAQAAAAAFTTQLTIRGARGILPTAPQAAPIDLARLAAPPAEPLETAEQLAPGRTRKRQTVSFAGVNSSLLRSLTIPVNTR